MLILLYQIIKLEYASRCCTISPDGKWLAVGCINGYVYVMYALTLDIVDTVKIYVNPDKDLIS